MKPMQSTQIRPWHPAVYLAASACAFFALSCAALAQSGSELCDQAATRAAQNSGVPVEILLAMTRVETGRSREGPVQPWPWAINLQGQGHWFEDLDQALAFATEHLANGVENFDVGCFQINLRWHGAKFRSLADVFDPQTNATYAAQFLSDLYASEGGWPQAVAAYHSRTPDLAATYLQKVKEVVADLPPIPDTAVIPVATMVRENRFPLLQGGASAGAGSIVPITQAATPLIGGFQ